MDEIAYTTAQELALAIRQNIVTAAEVVEALLERIARLNPALNAIVTLDEERARQRALEADMALARGELWGSLHGVPVTIKDAFATAGLRTTSGNKAWADFVPAFDATVVARLRSAGAIILGKTNLPAFSGNFQTYNAIFGRSNNPWNLEHTPGGSTGGGAAAVAAGLSPLEIGSDLGGSLRNPAHYCGVYTIKATEYRASASGYHPGPGLDPAGREFVRQQMSLPGPIARSIDDLALVLNVISGPDRSMPEIPPVPVETLPDVALPGLRIAWCGRFGDLPVSGETVAALQKLVSELAQLGCQVEECMPAGLVFPEVWEAWGALAHIGDSATMTPDQEEEKLAALKADPYSDDPILRGIARTRRASLRDYYEVLLQRDAAINALEEFFDNWDILLCPVAVGPAIPHTRTGLPIPVDGDSVPYWMAGLGYACPFNLSGNPAVAIPLTLSASGLPIGVQIVARRWADMKVLAFAKELATVIGFRNWIG